MKYFYQMALALQVLHRKNVIHRDLKAANIFLCDNFRVVKLGDMNVSKIVENLFATTQTGTPYYASPEIWRDETYSSKTDIWSLGCVLYEMCMLRPPFSASDMDELFEKVQKCKILPFDGFYSNELKIVVLKLLNKNPQKRPSCEDILKLQIFSKVAKKLKLPKQRLSSAFLSTLKMNKNLESLEKILPQSNYEEDKKASKKEQKRSLVKFIGKIPEARQEKQRKASNRPSSLLSKNGGQGEGLGMQRFFQMRKNRSEVFQNPYAKIRARCKNSKDESRKHSKSSHTSPHSRKRERERSLKRNFQTNLLASQNSSQKSGMQKRKKLELKLSDSKEFILKGLQK